MLHPWPARITRALRALPSQCAICQRWPATRLCHDCVQQFAAPKPRCQGCALPLTGGAARCGACLRQPLGLDGCWAGLDYAYPWSALLAAFKFHGDPGWAHSLGQLLLSLPGIEGALDAAELLLPIPLAPQRLRLRGFNQALLLARALAPHKVQAHAVLRLHERVAQSGLTRAQRLHNLQGAFVVEPLAAAQLAGRHLLLIDDVMTTGATLLSAGAALRQAGAASVRALVLARTPQD